jgi:NADH-quinone oxidoreductase subunit N
VGRADQLNWIAASFQLLWAELLLCGLIVVLIIFATFRKNTDRFQFFLTLTGIIVYTGIVIFDWPTTGYKLLAGVIQFDPFSSYFKVLIGVGGILTLIMSGKTAAKSNFNLLVVSTMFGADLMVMSRNFVMVVLAMELVSISSYALATGTAADKSRAETGWKFFLFGSASTALMIFGISYLYGGAGTLDFGSMTFMRNLVASSTTMTAIGGVLTMAGFLFKMTALPFHLWAPDVYERSPVAVVAFFSVVPKLAGLGIMIKFCLAMNLFGQSQTNWAIVIGTMAMLSVVVGNISALAQQNVKRMMAWSTVAQAGFLLIGVSCLTLESVQMSVYYATVFLVMNFAVFFIIQHAESTGLGMQLKSFAGWGLKALLPALALLVGLISLAGLPPTAGFMAKLFLFSGVWEKYQATGHDFFLLLLFVGLLNTVVALFYYLKLPWYMFIRQGNEQHTTAKTGLVTNLFVLIFVGLLLAGFFAPGLLMGWVKEVNFVL